MDFSNEYNKEQKTFAEEVRAWLNGNIPENLGTWRSVFEMTPEQFANRRALCRKLGEKGWLYPRYPKEYGGGGLSGPKAVVLHQEMAARGLSLPPLYDSGRLAAPTVMACGTDEQKKLFLPPILKGEKITWQLFTEPEAGTDEANQQTNALHAEREKDHFVINGGKIFVGGLYAPPDQFLLLTRSDLQAPRHQNLSMFLAPAGLAGIQILPLDLFPEGTIMQVAYQSGDSAPGVKHSVFFEDVRVPESYLIGKENDGWRVTGATLRVEHGEGGGEGGGERQDRGASFIPRNMLVEKCLDQCRGNPNVKQRFKDNPTLLDAVVDIYIGGQIERLFTLRNAGLPTMGVRAPHAGLQLTLHRKMFGLALTNHMAKVLGPYALTTDETWGLENRLFEVGERCGLCVAPGGTPEALKIILTRALRIGR